MCNDCGRSFLGITMTTSVTERACRKRLVGSMKMLLHSTKAYLQLFFHDNRLKNDKNDCKCCPWHQTISAI